MQINSTVNKEICRSTEKAWIAIKMYTKFAYFMLVIELDLLPLFSIESLVYRSVALVLKFGAFHDKKYCIVDIVRGRFTLYPAARHVAFLIPIDSLLIQQLFIRYLRDI